MHKVTEKSTLLRDLKLHDFDTTLMSSRSHPIVWILNSSGVSTKTKWEYPHLNTAVSSLPQLNSQRK